MFKHLAGAESLYIAAIVVFGLFEIHQIGYNSGFASANSEVQLSLIKQMETSSTERGIVLRESISDSHRAYADYFSILSEICTKAYTEGGIYD